MLEFFYPGNILFGKKIAAADNYALYGRSEVKVPCTECKDIQGVFYYKYIARGRLPFPAVIHLTEAERDFDEDRSRDIVSQATVVRAVYEVAEKLSPEASFWLLEKMKDQWQDIPVFKKKYPADLNTWCYVICQLVRNISSDSKWVKRFVREYPVDRYAYLDRIGSDYGKNRMLREAKRWFGEYNRGPDRRKLVNPIFRLLGIPSVLSEYMENRENLYREPQGKERECTELLRDCARVIFSQLNSGERLHQRGSHHYRGCTVLFKKKGGGVYREMESHTETGRIKLNLVMTYPVRWSRTHVMQDYIQNFYDITGAEKFSQDFNYCYNEKSQTLRMKSNKGFSAEWLQYMGVSTKREDNGSYTAGKFGEGRWTGCLFFRL